MQSASSAMPGTMPKGTATVSNPLAISATVQYFQSLVSIRPFPSGSDCNRDPIGLPSLPSRPKALSVPRRAPLSGARISPATKQPTWLCAVSIFTRSGVRRILPMMPIFIILGITVVGALYWLWRTALDDPGLAVVATAICAVFISVFSSTMVLAVM